MISEESKILKLNETDYTATCISCGEMDRIQLWPHRNGRGDLIGFIFGCERCKEIIPGITLDIHGIRKEKAMTN